MLAWIGLLSVPGVGRTTFRRLISAFGSADAVLTASADDLRVTGGVSEKVAAAIASRSWESFAEAELEQARTAGVTIITTNSSEYPAALRRTPDPPVVLYLRGSFTDSDDRALAIVGTRTPTHYGLTLTHRMAYELGAAGFTVVSGMARGIDTQAHKGALAAQGRTIAVLGCGIDVAYPPENRDLMERIAASGAVISENPLGTPPESGYFPARNRIISGLSRGTVIVEAAEDSGSLITANYAVKQDRLLFAVPGNVGSPTSRGPNSLIKQGAVLVETTGDILSRLGASSAPAAPQEPKRETPQLSDEERRIYDALGAEPRHIDQLMTFCSASPGKLGGLLTTLELKGLAKQLPGKYFIRCRN